MLKKIFLFLSILLILQIFYSCSGADAVKISSKDRNIIWDENDSEIIADSIVQKLLQSEWTTSFSKNRKPKIVVGSIKNRTSEKIDTEGISKNLERSLLKNGTVTFIDSKSDREMVRYDRKNRNDFDNEGEFKKYLRPLKSDFFISGTIILSNDSLSETDSKIYKLNLEIIDAKNITEVYSTNQTLNK